jgi:serine phosphatase RsbU (regulator of sigma subunit)
METINELLKIIVVSDKYNPEHITKRDDYILSFSNISMLEEKLKNNTYDIIIIDGTYSKDVPETLSLIDKTKNQQVFICGEAINNEELYKINTDVFLWEDKFENISLEKAIQLTKLKSTKSKYKKENITLKEKVEFQKIMLDELEQTNNNLISATWRERDLKKKLADTVNELNQTKDIVENQNKRITESINYARKIQLAINPTEADLKKHFLESFIFYLPKDVISGDFPWLFTIGDYIYVAAVDCTGHGVPGAMMSMIGNLLLNDITNDGNVLLPSEILKKLHDSVVDTLKQNLSDSNSNDGMDIGLLRINKDTKEVVYSGAHRPLFLRKNNEIEIFSGDKFPIGGMHYKGLNNYTNHYFKYNENDSVFLFTDGFPDQIGGEEKRKLMSKNMKLFFENNSALPMQELKIQLHDYFMNWKGSNKQIDDVLVLGINF